MIHRYDPPTLTEKLERPATWVLRTMVRAYQKLGSPLLPPMCRFHPSCSNYALDALARRRLLPAMWMIVWRLMRCNPFCEGGHNPVPETPRRIRPVSRRTA